MKHHLIVIVSVFLVISLYVSKADNPADKPYQTATDVVVTAGIDKDRLVNYLKFEVPLRVKISNISNEKVWVLLLHSSEEGIDLFRFSKPGVIEKVFPKKMFVTVDGLTMHLEPNQSQVVDVVYPISAFVGIKDDLMAGVWIGNPSYNGVVKIALSKPIHSGMKSVVLFFIGISLVILATVLQVRKKRGHEMAIDK